MRIGIDARMLGKGYGIGRYVEQLILQLEKKETPHEFVVFLRKENWDLWTPKQSNWTKVLADIAWYSVKEQTALPSILKAQSLDLMHFPHFNVPLLYTDPFVVTVHDLTMYHFPRPEATTLGPIAYAIKDRLHRLIVRSAVKKAKHIFTTTEFTKQDIADTLKVPKEKMTVTYQAPFEETMDEVSNTILPSPKYMLYVGAAYPHKNVLGLLRAWEIFEEEYGMEEYTLVLAGKPGPFYDSILASTEFAACAHVTYLGRVSDVDMPDLYSNATAFAFPSLYEGFGLPPLEAALHGTPVVCSNRSCLPEVVGEGAMFIDPENPRQFADALGQVASNMDLQHELVRAGERNVQRFSWETLAKETLAVYERLS
ncbi:MAG: glycosyltransferase family 4 protein [Candidatus Magasanikbacteria bacterium]|nr:glycosyltransferase family 4 protein [Candidatus Magasanikbacteria bacterium]